MMEIDENIIFGGIDVITPPSVMKTYCLDIINSIKIEGE